MAAASGSRPRQEYLAAGQLLKCSATYYVQRILLMEMKKIYRETDNSLIEITRICQFNENIDKHKYLAALLYIRENWVKEEDMMKIKRKIFRDLIACIDLDEIDLEHYVTRTVRNIIKTENTSWAKLSLIITALAKIIQAIFDHKIYGSLERNVNRIDNVLARRTVYEEQKLDVWIENTGGWNEVLQAARNLDDGSFTSSISSCSLLEDEYSSDSQVGLVMEEPDRCSLTYFIQRMVSFRLEEESTEMSKLLLDFRSLCIITENPVKRNQVLGFRYLSNIVVKKREREKMKRRICRELQDVGRKLNRTLYNYIQHKVRQILVVGEWSWEKLTKIATFMSILIPELYDQRTRNNARKIFSFVDKTLSKCKSDGQMTIDMWVNSQGGWIGVLVEATQKGYSERREMRKIKQKAETPPMPQPQAADAKEGATFPRKRCAICRVYLPLTYLKTVACTNCGISNCMAMGCSKAGNPRKISEHTSRGCYGQLFSRSIDPIKQCICGRGKEFIPGAEFYKCPVSFCRSLNCTITDDCDHSAPSRITFGAHKRKVHKQPPGAEDYCKNCPPDARERKNRSGGSWARCPKCEQYWCLRSRCSFETNRINNIKSHLMFYHRKYCS